MKQWPVDERARLHTQQLMAEGGAQNAGQDHKDGGQREQAADLLGDLHREMNYLAVFEETATSYVLMFMIPVLHQKLLDVALCLLKMLLYAHRFRG